MLTPRTGRDRRASRAATRRASRSRPGILDPRPDRDPRRSTSCPSHRSTWPGGQLATRDIVAPRALDYESQVQTDAARDAAERGRPAPVHVHQRERHRHRGRAAAGVRGPRLADRHDLLRRSHPGRPQRPCSRPRSRTCPRRATATLAGLDAARWAAVRTESARILDATLRTELRDTEVADDAGRLAGLMAGGLDEAERMLAAELISPLVVPNSSFSQPSRTAARPGRRGRRAGPRHDPPGRGHRPQRRRR